MWLILSKSKRDIEIKPIICSSSAIIDVFGVNRHVRIQQLIVCARNVLFEQSLGVDYVAEHKRSFGPPCLAGVF